MERGGQREAEGGRGRKGWSDGGMDVRAHKKIIVGYNYVRKSSQLSKKNATSPFNFNGINLILSLLAPLICQ